MSEKAFCRTCGTEIYKKTEACPECGVRQTPTANFSWTQNLGHGKC